MTALFSRRSFPWKRLAGSAGLWAVVLAFTRYVRPVEFTGDAELAQLMDERGSFKGADDRNRDELRDQEQRLRTQPLTPEAFGALRKQFGPGWRWNVPSRTPGEKILRFELSRSAPRLSDWPEIAQAVKTLETVPAIRLTRFEVVTRGRRGHRVLDHAVIEGSVLLPT